MEAIKSTAEILAFKVLNRNVDTVWVNWAVDMMVAGFDGNYLAILANENEPYFQNRLQDLAEKVLHELHLDYSDKDRIIQNYACYLIDKVLNNKIESVKMLETLKDIYKELNYVNYLHDFYLLYFAKTDLSNYSDQAYWPGAGQDNIDSIINEHLIDWKQTYAQGQI